MKYTLKNLFMDVVFNLLMGFVLGLILTSAVPTESPMIGESSIFSETSFQISSAIALLWVAIGVIRGFNSTWEPGQLHVGVNKEIWIDALMLNFYPKDNWLEVTTTDMSEFVEYDVINLAECGVDPVVLINNSTYPVASSTRTDSPLALTLDTFDTENTIVRNIEAMEVSYNKMESVVQQHRKSLRKTSGRKAAHAFGPASNTTATPVFATTGIDDGTGNALFTFEDIDEMRLKYTQNDFDMEDEIYCLLHPKHFKDLKKADRVLFKSFTDLKKGEMLEYAGIKFYVYNYNPTYVKSTLAKKAFGSAAAPVTDAVAASVFYAKSEVMKADGSYDMFLTEKSPTERGDVVGFQKRFLAMPIRNKGIGAIVTVDA